MTVTRRVYDAQPQWKQRLADEAYNEVAGVIRAAGYPAANDDRAERLVEAIAVYITESEAN